VVARSRHKDNVAYGVKCEGDVVSDNEGVTDEDKGEKNKEKDLSVEKC